MTMKVKEFSSLAQLGGTEARLDANEGIFLQRQLDYINEQVFEEAQPALNFLEFLPVKSDVPMWAESYFYRYSNKSGAAEFIGNGSHDFPVANMGMKEESERQRLIGAAVEFTRMDLMAAQANGIGLQAGLFMAARRAIEEKVNDIAWYGDANANLRGLLRHPEILLQPATNAIGGSTSADNVISELNSVVNSMLNNTEQVESPDMLLLPPDSYQYASQQQRSTASDTTTLNFWLATNGYVSAAAPVRELSNATIPNSGGGTTTSDVMVAMRRSREVCELIYSGITQLPILQTGPMTFCVPFVAACAGLAVYKPRAISLVTGV